MYEAVSGAEGSGIEGMLLDVEATGSIASPDIFVKYLLKGIGRSHWERRDM